MAKDIRFLFDFVSPYAYLASTQIHALAARHGAEVQAVPVLFAAMLDATGARGPAEIPAKRAYLYKDVVRLADALGAIIHPPATHPFNPLTALRVSGVVDDGPQRWQLVTALFRAAWVDAERIDRPDIVARIASKLGFDGAALLEQAATDEAKRRLRQTTADALAAGAFGVPSMLVDGELFWGLDALPLLDRFLRGHDPADAAHMARWHDVLPSATRRRSEPLG